MYPPVPNSVRLFTCVLRRNVRQTSYVAFEKRLNFNAVFAVCFVLISILNSPTASRITKVHYENELINHRQWL